MTENEMKYLNMIDETTRASIYQMIYIGVTAYNRFISENAELQKSKFLSNIKSRLLTFLIYRQFDEDMISKSFPLEVKIQKVNMFGYNSLMLCNKKVKVSLAKTKNKFSLPNKSKYRLEHCKDNLGIETQLKFNLDNESEKLIPAQIYVIIGFKIINDQLEYLNLIVPDASMETSIVNINLIDEYRKVINNSKEEPEIEEQIATIKKVADKFVTDEKSMNER